MFRIRTAAFLLATALLETATAAFAQLNRGTITGVVRDPSGAAIVNAQVLATHTDTNIVTKTNSTGAGDYSLLGLDIGTYSVSVEASGFRRAVRTAVTVDSGATVRLDFLL